GRRHRKWWLTGPAQRPRRLDPSRPIWWPRSRLQTSAADRGRACSPVRPSSHPTQTPLASHRFLAIIRIKFRREETELSATRTGSKASILGGVALLMLTFVTVLSWQVSEAEGSKSSLVKLKGKRTLSVTGEKGERNRIHIQVEKNRKFFTLSDTGQ